MASTSKTKATSSSSRGAGAGGVEAGEEEEDSESSSSSSSGTLTPASALLSDDEEGQDVESVLTAFRDKWKKEIDENAVEEPEADHETVEKARELFLAGAELERRGQLFSAIQKYKKAVQMVPDIEYRTFEYDRDHKKKEECEDDDDNDDVVLLVDAESEEPNDNPGTDDDLVSKFAKLTVAPVTGTPIPMEDKIEDVAHISCLPMELLILVLKWVVSDLLDLRSLESCSLVCRCFYVASRAPDLWRVICVNTWGSNSLPNPACWRQYFFSCPRVHLDGCYIAKISYTREGERGFQDEFYRPWHFIRYFRYLRFFGGGHVNMMTCAEEPINGVRLLRSKRPHNVQGVMSGHYRIVNNLVIGVLKRSSVPPPSLTTSSIGLRNKRRRNSVLVAEIPEQEFHFELEVRGKRHNQLHWCRYEVVQKRGGIEIRSDFDVSNVNTSPPLYFSRVKSYIVESEKALA